MSAPTDPSGAGPDPATVAALVTDLAAASPPRRGSGLDAAALLVGRFGLGSAVLAHGAELALVDAVGGLWERGWRPRDVPEIVRRTVSAAAVPAALDAVAADADRRPRSWTGELAGLGATVWWRRDRGLLGQWETVRGLGRLDALHTVLALVGAWRGLPALPVLDDAAEPAPGVDPRVLSRVRALLAKAESTSFPEEAEALSAKAQDLMARHALGRAVVDAGAERAPGAGARRLWLDAPYVSAKGSLVHEVATANRCRAIAQDALELVTVVGHPVDLDTVEVLVTSLLVQADRAMLAAGRRTDGVGTSRTRSFRRSFLLSYAARIGERLREAGRAAQEATRAESGDALLPALVARQEAVERTVAELFPRLRSRRLSVGDAAGWAAGRAAADTAALDPARSPLPHPAG